MIGAAAAHWSFRFVVLMPFDYEIGSPEWQEDPKWLEDEEKQRQEEEEALRLCGWRRRSWKERGRRPQIALSPSSDIEKAQVGYSSLPPNHYSMGYPAPPSSRPPWVMLSFLRMYVITRTAVHTMKYKNERGVYQEDK